MQLARQWRSSVAVLEVPLRQIHRLQSCTGSVAYARNTKKILELASFTTCVKSDSRYIIYEIDKQNIRYEEQMLLLGK